MIILRTIKTFKFNDGPHSELTYTINGYNNYQHCLSFERGKIVYINCMNKTEMIKIKIYREPYFM